MMNHCGVFQFHESKNRSERSDSISFSNQPSSFISSLFSLHCISACRMAGADLFREEGIGNGEEVWFFQIFDLKKNQTWKLIQKFPNNGRLLTPRWGSRRRRRLRRRRSRLVPLAGSGLQAEGLRGRIENPGGAALRPRRVFVFMRKNP